MSRFRYFAGLLGIWMTLPACTHFGIPGVWAAADASFADPAIDESSGIVKSRRLPELFWTHNDSGDRPRIFAVRSDGSVVGGVEIAGAQNIDWEDIAIDDDGHLFLCDIGNNLHERKELTIYQVPEVDPARIRSAKVSAKFPFRFPDDAAPNAEACFIWKGAIYVLTKERRKTEFYRLDLSHPGRKQTATFVGEREVESRVTGADLTPDGRFLAVLTYSSIEVFARPAEGDNFLADHVLQIPLRFGQDEAIAWDGDDLILTNESGQLLRRSGVRGLLKEP